MAGVRGKLPAARTVTPEAEKKHERRLLLPSNRVAVFRLPNVGEYLDLRAEAVRKATEIGRPTDQSIGLELGKLFVRRQLVGLTPAPVESVFKPGFDLAAHRAKLEAELPDINAKRAAERAKLIERGTPPTREEIAATEPIDLDAALAAAEDAAEDVEATKAAARPHAISDLLWDEDDEGPVAAYLAAMPKAMLDEPAGADWQALNDYATLTFPNVMRGVDAPKAQRPRIRSLR